MFIKMFSSAKFFAFIMFIAEAKFLYEPDESPSVYVNNMKLEPTYLTEDTDMVEYQYIDGDVVKIRCGDFDTLYGNIIMEYAMTDTLRDLFNTTLPTGNLVGFVTKLHSGHNNSYVICRNEDNGVQILVKFILQAELAFVSIKIDEMTIRQEKKLVGGNTYILIDYQHLSSIDNETIEVVCEMEHEDLQLEVMDTFVNNLTDYKKTELIKSKKSEISFVPSDANYKLQCLARDINGETSETVVIRVTRYMFFTETCWEDGCTINKELNLTQSADNTTFACYYMERTDMTNTSEHDILVAELRVLFSMRSTTSLTALISSNKTIFWESYQRMTADIPGSENTDQTTTIIVSVVSVVGVLCGLAFLILWLSRRHYERNLNKRIAANTAPPFYLNLILRGDCDRRIAELDQHVYEEIGPPIYEVIDSSALTEINYTVHKKNNGSVCGESAPVSEETHAIVHKNMDAPVHEEIEALVHKDSDTSTHEEFDAHVHRRIDTSKHKGIDELVSKVTDKDE